jgi:adenylate kinase family enzyme
MSKLIYFVLGGPGSGKGTFCEKLTKIGKGKISHYSAGELLRNFMDHTAKLDGDRKRLQTFQIIDTFIKEGSIVPAHITVGLLLSAIERSSNRYVLIDGFPRNMDNYDTWSQMASEYNDIVTKKLVFLKCLYVNQRANNDRANVTTREHERS